MPLAEPGPGISLADGTWGAFETARNRVRYDLTHEFEEDYPTDGSPRTFTHLARVRWSFLDTFLQDVLPDVVEEKEETGETLELGTLTVSGVSTQLPNGDLTNEKPIRQYTRRKVTRKIPQQHPRHRRAFVVKAVVIRGEGAHRKTADGAFAFADRDLVENQWRDGLAVIRLTYSDLPYPVATVFRTLNGVVVPDETSTDDDVNSSTANELYRYCTVKQIQRGQSLQVRGRVFLYVSDDGDFIFNAQGNPLPVAEQAQSLYMPTQLLHVSWKMFPRIPLGAMSLLGHVNQETDFNFPYNIFPASYRPAPGTLLYVGLDHSQMYFTVSGNPCFDIDVALLYRPGGDDVYRGHNSVWCPEVREFRRVVTVDYTKQGTVFIPQPAPLMRLPVSSPQMGFPFGFPQTANVFSNNITYRPNMYSWARIGNIFKLEGNAVGPQQ